MSGILSLLGFAKAGAELADDVVRAKHDANVEAAGENKAVVKAQAASIQQATETKRDEDAVHRVSDADLDRELRGDTSAGH